MFSCWLGMVILMELGPLSLGVLPIIAALVLMAFRTRSWRPIVVVLLSPIMLSLSLGVLVWFSLRPSYRTFGLPDAAFFNLDPKTRTYHNTWGCLIDEGEMQSMRYHNFALECMCRVFGKPPNTYSGLYPSKEDADKETVNAPTILPEAFLEGALLVDGQHIYIGAKQSRAMLKTTGIPEGHADKMTVRVREISSDCLLVRLIYQHRLFAELNTDAIFLLDRQRKWPFAIYDFVPDSLVTRYPYFVSAHDVSELREYSPPPPFLGPLY